MNEVRSAFLDAVDACRAGVAAPQTSANWDQLSVLPGYNVRGLAGHLARGVTTVLEYLAAPEPSGDPIPAATYFARIPPAPEVTSPQQAAIRQRGEDMAAGGPERLGGRLDADRSELARILPAQPLERKVSVFGGQIMRLDDYLLTRIVELLIHRDDLAASVGLPSPEPPRAAADLALVHLLDVARFRSGDLAVLRAFSRRERDASQALRLF
jgi:hypothetical protein